MRKAILWLVALLAFVPASLRGESVWLYNDETTGYGLLDSCATVEGRPLLIDKAVTGHVPYGDRDLSIALRLRTPNKRQGPGYALFLTGESGDTIRLTIRKNSSDDPLRDIEGSLLSLALNDKVLKEVMLPRRTFDNADGFNTLRVQRSAGILTVRAGKKETTEVIRQPLSNGVFGGKISSFGIAPLDGSSIELSRIQLTVYPTLEDRLATNLDKELLSVLTLDSFEGPEGFWSLLDYDLDDKYLRTGGDYKLAVVDCAAIRDYLPGEMNSSSPEATYAVIYLSGAVTDKDKWTEGMIKGFFVPTGLSSAWRLVWFDSEGNPVDAALSTNLSTATLDSSGNLLTLSFPGRYSTIRLFRNR